MSFKSLGGAAAAVALVAGVAGAQSPAGDAPIDHVIFQTPDLEKGVDAFAARSGLAPAYGGAHVSGGTANYLASLGDGAYFEILGPAKDRIPDAEDRATMIAAGPEELATFAIQVGDAQAFAAAARAAGLEASGPYDGGRMAPSGAELRWRSVIISDGKFCSFVPFAIEWREGTTHPSATSPPGLSLLRFEIEHPDAAELNRIYAAIGATVRARPAAAPAMRAVIGSPNGEITLSRASAPCAGW